MSALIRWLVLLLVCGAVAYGGMTISPSTPVHTHADNNTGGSALTPATIALSGTLSSTKACAAGYVRVGPNLCLTLNPQGIGSVTPSLGCTQSTALTGVTDAKAVLLNLTSNLFSTNAVGLKKIGVIFFEPTDNLCAANGGLGVTSNLFWHYEFAATAATQIQKSTISRVLESDSSGRFYYTEIGTGTAGSSVGMGIAGYFD